MGKKIAIVGAGNAGCLSALECYFNREEEQEGVIGEIEIYHDPDIPIERVGQGLQLNSSVTVFESLDMNWLDKNFIKATVKQGINYEGWGNKNPNFFHPFGSGQVAAHYIPSLLSQETLKSGLFNVIEKKVTDIDSQVDADYVIDCRGTPKNLDDYEILTNPINSVILGTKSGKDPDLLYTRHVATPHGWTFIIPNHDSVSYGYLYNNKITSYDEARDDFLSRFDGVSLTGDLNFKNYVAKNLWVNERTLLNGNRYSFIEPLEATSSGVHIGIANRLYEVLLRQGSHSEVAEYAKKEVKKCQDFILWHYKSGSMYDTNFWRYARELEYSDEHALNKYIEESKNAPRVLPSVDEDEEEDKIFAQWGPHSFKVWYENT